MFIIISDDTTARSRCTSRRDGRASPRLRWTHTHVDGAHLHTPVTRARIRANPPACPCARKEESDRFDLGAFFSSYLDGYPPPLLSRTPLFFRTTRQDHQSASRGLLRGYATRLPPRGSLRVPGEASPIRAHQGSPFRPPPPYSPSSLSFREFPRFFRFIGVSVGLARWPADVRANEATSFWRIALSFAERKRSARSRGSDWSFIVASTYLTVVYGITSPSERPSTLRCRDDFTSSLRVKNLPLAASLCQRDSPSFVEELKEKINLL